MQDLFSWIDRAVEGTPGVALTATFVWGVLSVILSPCRLASLPLIVGFIDDQGRTTARRAFFISLLFSVGILATIGLIGVLTAGLGRMAGDIGPYGNYAVSIVAAGVYLIYAAP